MSILYKHKILNKKSTFLSGVIYWTYELIAKHALSISLKVNILWVISRLMSTNPKSDKKVYMALIWPVNKPILHVCTHVTLEYWLGMIFWLPHIVCSVHCTAILFIHKKGCWGDICIYSSSRGQKHFCMGGVFFKGFNINIIKFHMYHAYFKRLGSKRHIS